MKETELRIGNYYYHPIALSFERMDDIDFISSFIEKFEPIPLTEEWLLKFGFEKVGESFFKGLEVFTDSGNFFYGLRDEGQMDLHLEYVHQFQNWYHALKQTELTISK